MPIVGTFEADFTQFQAATRAATGELQKLQGQASVMERAFAEMDADRHVVRLSDDAGKASNALGTMAVGLGAVDRTLAQFGVNLTPQVAALREMSTLLGTATAAFGPWAAAITAAAAAAAIFFNRRQIQEWGRELDDWIAETASDLMGWGDAFRSAQIQIEATRKEIARGGQWLADTLDKINEDLDRKDRERNQAQAAEFEKRFDEASRARAKRAEEERKEAERQKREEAEALKREEKEWRDYQNWLGIRFMEDEAARMKAREDEHAAMLARMKAEEAAFIGLTITGGGFGGSALPMGPALPTTPFGSTGLGGGGVTVFGEGGPVATGGGIMVHPSISGNLNRGNVTVNAPINIIDTQQNLARDIGAQITKAVMQGTKFS